MEVDKSQPPIFLPSYADTKKTWEKIERYCHKNQWIGIDDINFGESFSPKASVVCYYYMGDRKRYRKQIEKAYLEFRQLIHEFTWEFLGESNATLRTKSRKH